jgi:hypothetical protein
MTGEAHTTLSPGFMAVLGGPGTAVQRSPLQLGGFHRGPWMQAGLMASSIIHRTDRSSSYIRFRTFIIPFMVGYPNGPNSTSALDS